MGANGCGMMYHIAYRSEGKEYPVKQRGCPKFMDLCKTDLLQFACDGTLMLNCEELEFCPYCGRHVSVYKIRLPEDGS